MLVDILLVITIIVFIILILAIVLGERNRKRRLEEIRRQVLGGDFITAEQFEINRTNGALGYPNISNSDTSGCYVILIFDVPVMDGNYEDYCHGYIGQSENVVFRVHSHLTGNGNGDVYADKRYGKHLYIKIITCPVEELNSLEVKLIAAFDWNRLYNKSKGGGVGHKGIPDKEYSGTFQFK